MKTLGEIQGNLKMFTDKFNLSTQGVQQGSEAWLQMKLGVLSASNADKIVAGTSTEGRATYMAKLIGQICTSIVEEEMPFKQIEWGRTHEDAARSSYEFSTGESLIQIPFIFSDENYRVGLSTDSLIENKRDVEIKCPWDTAHYVKFLIADKIKSEWNWQNQFGMWVLGSDTRDFVQYDPRMKVSPMKILTVERDEKMQKTLSDAIPQFISDMDRHLESIGARFGDQWARLNQLKEIA